MKGLLFTGFLLLALAAQAQAPYQGGIGDGYARASLTTRTTPPPAFQFDIARTQFGEETIFEVRLDGLQTTVELDVFDAAGRRVWNWWSLSSEATTVEVTTRNWASGPYLFRLSANARTYTKKVVHVSGGGN